MSKHISGCAPGTRNPNCKVCAGTLLICPEREHGCEFETKSEHVFSTHLDRVHAMTPHQIGREIARQRPKN